MIFSEISACHPQIHTTLQHQLTVSKKRMSLSEGGNLLLCCDCQGTQTSDSVKNAAGWCFQSQKTQPESYPSFKIWLLEAHSSARDGRPVIVRFCLLWQSGHRLCAINSLTPALSFEIFNSGSCSAMLLRNKCQDISFIYLFAFIFSIFWPHRAACGILVP